MRPNPKEITCRRDAKKNDDLQKAFHDGNQNASLPRSW
jgi:hypothetical protein